MNFDSVDSELGNNLWIGIVMLTTVYGGFMGWWLYNQREKGKNMPLLWFVLAVWFIGGYTLAINSLS